MDLYEMSKDEENCSLNFPTQSLVIESTTDNTIGNSAGMLTEGRGGVSQSDLDESRLCMICGQMSHGYHFGILACRACAAFFRRTVVEKKTYFCRQNGQCPIKKELRNMCRACRFERCIHLGMNKEDVQLNRDPIGKRRKSSSLKREEFSSELKFQVPSVSIDLARPKPHFVSSSSDLTSISHAPPIFSAASTPTTLKSGDSTAASVSRPEQTLPTTENSPIGISAKSLSQIVLPLPIRPHRTGIRVGNGKEDSSIALLHSPIPFNSNGAFLQRLLDGYRNFQSAQKSLYIVMYPDNIFAGETYRLVKHSEYVKMERGCVSLMYSMLTDCFPAYDSLAQELKIAALRLFSNRFTHLDQCFRTLSVFPERNDSRFVLHYGQFLDGDKMEHFFGDEADPAQAANSCNKTVFRCRRIVDRMRNMTIRDVEVAALAAIILWNELAYLDVQDAKTKETIYSELHNNMVLNYGIAATGKRLGQLMDLIQDFNLIEREIRESCIINKFFNPDFAEVWDDA